MSTIEGGMICTNDNKLYQMLRMFRSHGMVREMNDFKMKMKFKKNNTSLDEKFIFAYPAYNLRNTELSAIIGLNQLKKLDRNIKLRNRNHQIFLNNINNKIFKTDFDLMGSSNYAFNLILKKPDKNYVKRLMKGMDNAKIEYRRGSAGGGNQLRQPYLKKYIKENHYLNFPETEHVHFYGFYLGNYPSLTKTNIIKLCRIINSII